MMNLGYSELLLLLIFPLSGCLAALYLGVALTSNARRRQERQ
jgi:hypothetical protein